MPSKDTARTRTAPSPAPRSSEGTSRPGRRRESPPAWSPQNNDPGHSRPCTHRRDAPASPTLAPHRQSDAPHLPARGQGGRTRSSVAACPDRSTQTVATTTSSPPPSSSSAQRWQQQQQQQPSQGFRGEVIRFASLQNSKKTEKMASASSKGGIDLSRLPSSYVL